MNQVHIAESAESLQSTLKISGSWWARELNFCLQFNNCYVQVCSSYMYGLWLLEMSLNTPNSTYIWCVHVECLGHAKVSFGHAQSVRLVGFDCACLLDTKKVAHVGSESKNNLYLDILLINVHIYNYEVTN